MTTDRSRIRTAVKVLIAVAIVLAAHQAWYYAGGPRGQKDCGPIAPRPPAGASVINDVSCLNPTPVSGVVTVRSEDDVRRALEDARTRHVKVSVAGARHSQGGHAFANGNIVLDMRGFNRIRLDEAAEVVRVQSGATWHDIQNVLHPRFAVKAMQSTDVFTVGGSISVNAHGMDHRAGSVGRTVRSMRVMLANGEVRTVGPTSDPELFRLVVGGYGLFGVILDVEIELTRNAIYRSGREVMDYRAFPAFFNDRILRDESYRLVYAHLSTAPQSLLRETLVYTYQEVDAPLAIVPPLAEVHGVGLRRLVFNASKLGGTAMRLKWWAEKRIEPMLESCPASPRRESRSQSTPDGCLVSRNDPMHDSVPYLMNRLSGETDILQEYFIPRDRLVTFVDGLRDQVVAHRANLLNASVRVVHREDNLLTYAPSDNIFAVVLYLNQKTTAEANERMARFTHDLIELTLQSGGRFFLPYQLHYTPDQLRRAYPEIEAFFKAKDVYDPDHLFTNTFYNKYAPEIVGSGR
jgi:FAD/FMN-containing dehydrogenase